MKSHALPVMEQLESRTLLAGAVTVLCTPTSLTLLGSANGDSVWVSASGGAGTQCTVTGTGGTVVTVKGTLPTSSASLNVLANMGAGDDSVMITNMLARNITFYGGTGVDLLQTAGMDVRGNLVALMGPSTASQANTVLLGSGTYYGAVTISGGNDADTIGLGVGTMFPGPATFLGRVVINTLGGNDYVGFAPTASTTLTFNGVVLVLTGLGNDTLTAGNGTNTTTFNGNTTLDLGAGDDILNVDSTKSGSSMTFNGAINRIALGTGNDTTTVSGGMRAGCIIFGANTANTITGGLGVKSTALRQGLLGASINAGIKSISFAF